MRGVVDLGGTSTRYSVFSNGELAADVKSVETEAPEEQLESIATDLEDMHGISEVGVATTGTTSDKGIERISKGDGEAYPEVEGVDFLFENDTNAAALGESLYGAGEEFEDVLYVTFSTGISAGLVQDGEIVRGGGNFGKIGNYVLKGQDTWENLCSGEAIPETFQEFTEGGYSAEDAADVFELAERNQEAEEYLKEFLGRCNGLGLSNACVSYDPDVVVLGGSVAVENERVLDDLEPWFKEFFPDRYESPELRNAELGHDSELYGAGSL